MPYHHQQQHPPLPRPTKSGSLDPSSSQPQYMDHRGGGGGRGGALAATDGPGGACSPASAASEDTEVTLPATLEGAGDEAHEEAELSAALAKQEDIRFASYRTAAKLRCLQRQTYLYHIDIWSMIEAFRERGLHGLDPNSKLPENKVRALLASLYGDLQKRLPPGASTSASASSQHALMSQASSSSSAPNFLKAKENLLFSFLWRALRSSPHSDRLRVRTLKAALATLCVGKLMDKLRYLFSQLCDEEGHLVRDRLALFLRDVMRIPAALGEYTSFTDGSETAEALAIFGDDDAGLVTANDFLETMMSDPGPQCLSWLLVLHRLINSETAFHPVACGSCLEQGFHGLRYKSDRGEYHLCQNCFWRGLISREHADDVFKEYNTFKPCGKSSLKRSLHCIPSEKQHGRSSGAGQSSSSSYGTKGKHQHHHYKNDQPERQLDLSNLVPAPPGVIVINGEMQQRDFAPGEYGHHVGQQEADEHRLIAQYASQIAEQEPQQHQSQHQSRRHRHTHRQQQQQQQQQRPPSTSPGKRSLSKSRQLVADLEKKNREIMRDINELRQQQGEVRRGLSGGGGGGDGGGGSGGGSPKLLSELTHLRNRKNMLDERLVDLQDTRQELMTELEELMKLLRSQKVTPPPPDLTVTDPTGGRYSAFGGHGGGGGGAAAGHYAGSGYELGDEGLYPQDPSLPSYADE